MLTAIYDGNCVICKRTKAFIVRLDRHHQVKFVDLHQRDELAEQFPNISHEQAMGMIHVIDEKGRVYAGFDAVCRLFRQFPLTFPVYMLSRTPFLGRRVGEFVYHIIARNRYGINRLLGGESYSDRANCDTEQCKLS
jgi:predicted DCC family thiol-disulfide oxidoreductase YuxK